LELIAAGWAGVMPGLAFASRTSRIPAPCDFKELQTVFPLLGQNMPLNRSFKKILPGEIGKI